MTKKELKSLIRECINEVVSNEYRGQRLNFKAQKNKILDAFNNAIKTKNYNVQDLSEILYKILREGQFDDFIDVFESFSKDDRERYRNAIDKNFPVWNSDTGWVQVNINKHYPKKSGKITYNYYISIERTKENLLNYIDAIEKHASELKDELNILSDAHQSPISYKTLETIGGHLGENDNFKVFYYDKDLKDDIVKIVNKWFARNKVKTAPRTHSHGFDTDISYGTILSQTIAREVMKLVQTYGSKYTPEQYYEWLVKNFADMVSKIKHPDST